MPPNDAPQLTPRATRRATRRTRGTQPDPANQPAQRHTTMDGGCYSKEQIGAAMILTGWPKDETVIADGIATTTAEDGRCRVGNGYTTGAAARSPGVCCWGPWALNKNNGGQAASEACAADLFCSTKVALTYWQGAGQSFGPPLPWSAASKGSAGDHDIAKTLLTKSDTELTIIAAENAPADSITFTPGGVEGKVEGAFNDVASAVGAVATVLAKIAQFFVGAGELLLTPAGWLRLGKILGGAILLLWALNQFMKQGTGIDVAKGIRKVASAAGDAAAVARA